MKLSPICWLVLVASAAASNQGLQGQFQNLQKKLDQSATRLRSLRARLNELNSPNHHNPQLTFNIGSNVQINILNQPTTTNGRKLLHGALQNNEDLSLMKQIKNLIIANQCKGKCGSILRFIEHQEGADSNARLQDIPMTEIKTLCSLIEKDRARISAQSINQFLQPYFSSILKIAGALSLAQALIHYLGENKTIILGAPTIVATLALLNYPLYIQAEKRRDDQRNLAEVGKELQGNILRLK